MNVVFYAMDSLRADHIHAFGYPRQTTPVMDRLVAGGAAFEQCYAQSGWTAPSAATILSSQYPSATGIHKMRDALNPDMPWLPEVLQRAGYQTVGFSTVYQMSKLRGFDRGFDRFEDLFKDPETIERCRQRDQASRGDDYCLPLSEDMHVRALRWLDQRRDSEDSERPFFMLLWSIDTHEPFRQPAEYNVDVDPDYRGRIDGRGRPFKWIRHRRDLQQVIDLYDGSLRYQDAKLGELIDELDRRELLDDTLIVVFADHGEMFFEHGVAGHGKFPWEHELRVPLIMHGPKHIPAEVRSSSLVQLIDLAPTVLDLAGLGPESRFRGRSLGPLLKQPDQQLHEAVVIEVPSPFHREEYSRIVREENWKYIEYHPPRFSKRLHKYFKELGRGLTLIGRPGMLPILYGSHLRTGPLGVLRSLFVDPALFLAGKPTRRLFDLQADPEEMRDRLRQQPQVAERLQQRFALLEKTATSAGDTDQDADVEEKIMDHLRALGYVE